MNVKQKLCENQVVLGTWCQSGSATVAEIMSDYGFDFIALDMEHTDLDESSFSQFARAVDGKSVPMARVRENDVLAIRRVLDCGAQGVIVPLISTAQDAARAVAAAKYPPEGIRGFAFVQANRWGLEFDRYAKEANDQITVIAMIESKEAVENIDQILSVDGLDGILIGPYDLSGSYGVVGQTSHPLVLQAKETVLERCLLHKKAAGQHIVLPTHENVEKAICQGYTFLALGMDTVFISEGAQRAVRMAGRREPLWI